MMTQLKSEIVAVGTELLLGQIANTNAQWISEQLAAAGIDVYYHSVAGDNLQRLTELFRQAEQRSDIIIITGGLGPTDDDLTREAFQCVSHLELIEHKPSMDKIAAHFRQKNSHMTPNNRRQARVFKGASVLYNHVGMAPGMIVNFHEKRWVFLPGVPKEMKALVAESVIPYLKQMQETNMVIQSETLKFIGIGESQLEHELKPIIDKQSNPTIAPLAQASGVVVRLTAKAHSKKEALQLIDKTKQEILQKAGKYLYGFDDEKLEQKVFELLLQKKWTVSSAESLTGGMFADRLVAIEGASSVFTGGVVCYDTSVKERLLKIPEELIREKGTVSSECAAAMARQVKKLLHSSVGISFTGVAGPVKIENQPAGTVYIAVVTSDGKEFVKKYLFKGDRQAVRDSAVVKGYEILYHYLKSDF